MIDLAVEACGMVTGVGLNAPSSCAAIRCGLSNFDETRFIGSNGEWIMASQVPLDQPWRGQAKLAHMAAAAIRECIAGLNPGELKDIPILLCVAETGRPGRVQGQQERLLNAIQDLLHFKFNPASGLLANGRVSGVQAILKMQTLLSSGNYRYGIVAGVDTYLTAGTLSAYDKAGRLLTEENSDGFIPGEAGTAVLLTPANLSSTASIVIKGIGMGSEPAPIGSGLPLRADGMVQAIGNALSQAGLSMGDLDYRICDVSGEQFGFKEAALALTRILRKRKEEFDIWHPAECIGETGAAIVPCVLAVASAAMAKGYSKGDGIICHFGNDDGQRAAMVVIKK